MPIAFRAAKSSPVAVSSAKSPPKVATARRARMSGLGQPQYLANTIDVQRIQNALRAAERGDTWILFTLFRDMYASYGHLQAEWAKRKCVITGEPEALIPHDADDPDDVVACDVIRDMIDNCRNWFDGLNHLLDATLWPLAAAEKIFQPVGMADNEKFKHPLRMTLKEIAPIDPTLLCFKLPYVPGYTAKENGDGVFNPDDWEAWLRFYSTSPQGNTIYSLQNVYRANPSEHIIHRGNMLSPTLPPNFGAILRMILFPWLLATQDRDWWAQFMQKYGQPILVGKVNSQQQDTVAYMQSAFSLCQQLGGLVVDSKAAVESLQVSTQDGANAHRIFQEWCDMTVSKLVVGQVLSSTPKNTGMGSGMANQAEEVREDIRQYDTMKLADTLEKQLFRQFLDVNGYRGHAPHIRWGGMRENAASTLAKTLANVKQAGYILSSSGLRTVNQKFGYELEVDPNPMTPGAPDGNGTNRSGKNVKFSAV